MIIQKDQQQTQQQHLHVMSEDEAAGLRKQLIRFHCISCDRPIDVQPHPFVSFFSSFDIASMEDFLLDSNPVFPQIRVCVPSSHPDHTLPTNWTKFANFKRGELLRTSNNHIVEILFVLVSSLVMSLVVVQQMFMQLFDSVVVHTQRHFHSNDKSRHSKSLFS